MSRINTPNSFTPRRFVSVGATGAMFTLRQTYLHTWYSGSSETRNGVFQGQVHYEERNHHVQNLGTTLDVAFPKAQQLARAAGLQLSSTLESLRDDLRKITKRTAEEVHEDMMEQRYVNAANHAMWAQRNDELRMERMAKFPLWTFSYGQYEGKTVAEVAEFDRGYLEWITKETGDDPMLFQMQIATYLETHPVAALESNHVGDVKERIEITGTVNKRFTLPNSEWGSDLIKITDDAGNVFVTFYSGTAWDPEVGSVVHIKATVKDHGIRDDVKQTMIGRVAAVKG